MNPKRLWLIVILSAVFFALSLLVFGSSLLQGIGNGDCFYNNPDPVAKASCKPALDRVVRRQDQALAAAIACVLIGGSAYWMRRRTLGSSSGSTLG